MQVSYSITRCFTGASFPECQTLALNLKKNLTGVAGNSNIQVIQSLHCSLSVRFIHKLSSGFDSLLTSPGKLNTSLFQVTTMAVTSAPPCWVRPRSRASRLWLHPESSASTRTRQSWLAGGWSRPRLGSRSLPPPNRLRGDRKRLLEARLAKTRRRRRQSFASLQKVRALSFCI